MKLRRALLLVPVMLWLPVHAAPGHLISASPFLSPEGESAAVLAPERLKFAGLMQSATGTYFCIRNPARHGDVTWVGLNETGHDFQVRSYDPASETIEVDTGGRILRLSLPQSKVVASSKSDVAPAVAAAPAAADVPTAPLTKEAGESEAQRIAEIRARIARQRQIHGLAPPRGF